MTASCDTCRLPMRDDDLSVEAWEREHAVRHVACPIAPKPVRVRLRRTAGWRKPANTVVVTRGPNKKWGNPYIVGSTALTRQRFDGPPQPPTPENCVRWFREYVLETPGMLDEVKRELRGKNLACFCALDAPCHADVLLELANG